MTSASNREILSRISRLRREQLRVRFLGTSARTLFYTAVAAAVVVAFVDIPIGLLVGGVLAVTLGTAAILTVLHRRDQVALAKDADDHLGLKDRLSSAVDLEGQVSEGKGDGPMVQTLLQDASRLARELNPRGIYRFSMPMEGWLVPVPAALLIGILLFAGTSQGEPPTNEELERLLAGQGEALEKVIDELKRQQDPRLRDQLKLLEDLSADINKNQVEKKEALSKLSEVMKQLEEHIAEQQKRLKEQKELLKKLNKNELTKKLADEINEGNYDEAMRRLKELEKDLRKKLEDLKKRAKPAEIAELEKQLKDLKELKGKLLNLRNLKLNIRQTGQVLDFLAGFEGELGEITDFDVADVKYFALGKP